MTQASKDASDVPVIPEHLQPVLVRLTWNGAYNLRRTLTNPHDRFPDLLAGGQRLFTGLGKYTTLAAIGVENNLKALGLVERRSLPWNGPEEHHAHESLCMTPLGRDVAEFLNQNWNQIGHTFREGRKER